MKIILRFVACFFVMVPCILLFACSGEKSREPGRYYNDEMGFSIEFPEGWRTIKGDGVDASLVEGVSPWEDEEDPFSEYIGVDVAEYEEKIALEDFFRESREAQAEEFEYYAEIEQGDIEINGAAAKYIIFDIGMEEGKNRVIGFMLVKNKRGYLVSCVAEESKYDDYVSAFEEAAQSFRIE